MAKKQPKVFPAFVVLIMLILMIFSYHVNAAEQGGTCGQNLTWRYEDETGVLRISGKGSMENYVCSDPAFWSVEGPSWNPWESSIHSVIIEHGVTSIGDSAFRFCDNMVSIEIPSSVTKIGKEAFFSCKSLVSIEIPDSVSHVGESAFQYCSNLERVSLPSAITSIEKQTFDCCRQLRKVTIPETVRDICYGAFMECEGLKEISIPSSVQSIQENAFAGCTGFKNVTIPKSVQSIESGAFCRCDQLSAFSVSADSRFFMNDEHGALYDKLKTKIIQFPPNCLQSEYVVPETVTQIYARAFENCNHLKSIEIPDSVRSIEAFTFFRCSNLEIAKVGNGVKEIGFYSFGECEKLIDISLGKGLKKIGEEAFTNCYSLKRIEIPYGVTDIEDYAFCVCGLTSITIPSSVKKISNEAFSGCNELTDIFYGGTQKQWNASFSQSVAAFEIIRLHYNTPEPEAETVCIEKETKGESENQGYIQNTTPEYPESTDNNVLDSEALSSSRIRVSLIIGSTCVLIVGIIWLILRKHIKQKTNE